MISYSLPLLILLLPSNIIAIDNYKTACELLELPRDCHCQRTRGVPNTALNETRLRCRQFTKNTSDYRWAIVPYDRLAFEIPGDNFTLDRYAFADVRARTIRFDVENLFLNDHAFDNAYIGQLAISHVQNFGKIHFQLNGQIFYGSTITNFYLKTVDFQTAISEIIFSNTKIYSLIIQSSKFYGFTNKKFLYQQSNETAIKANYEHDNFLEYDLMSTPSSSYPTSSPSSPLKIRRKKKKKVSRQTLESSGENSPSFPEQTVTINITSINLPAFVTIYTILSSINTTNLTEHYFPNNFEYSQTDEIELSYNSIHSIDAHAFRHLQFFEGRLILTFNQIHYISPYAFADLYTLNNLSLANNHIQNLSGTHFQHLNHLQQLDLSSNQLKHLKNETFQHLLNLQVLSLNNNPLISIESDVFTTLTDLKEVHLQGVPLTHSINPEDTHWIWNLAKFHVNYLLNTNFDLSDVAFCLLTRSNQSSFHLPREHPCSCNVHYFYSTTFLPTNYLRLTPICLDNQNRSLLEHETNISQVTNTTDFLLRNLENQCDYKFDFLDCDAMTTTTQTTAIPEETTVPLETTVEISIVTTTPWYFKYTKPPKNKANNTKKLFIVLATLAAITVAAIILVILWYRLEAIYKRKQKKKKIIEQQRNFNSSLSNNSHRPRYASTDILNSIYSAQLAPNKSQSQVLIESAAPPTRAVFENADVITNASIDNFIDDEKSLQQHPTTNDLQATTEF